MEVRVQLTPSDCFVLWEIPSVLTKQETEWGPKRSGRCGDEPLLRLPDTEPRFLLCPTLVGLVS